MDKTMRAVALLTLLGGCSLLHGRQQPRVPQCTSNLKNIATALRMYASDNSGRYPANMKKLEGYYLKLIPTCPATATDTYSATYKFTAAAPDAQGKVVSEHDSFEFYCAGNNHAKSPMPPNRPRYESDKGLILR